MKVLFAAYRSWALTATRNIIHDISALYPDLYAVTASTKEQFDDAAQSVNWDVIVLIGWSWIVRSDIVENNYIIAYHPSDLPDYAGGSPIQHQIIDGLKTTQATLFRVTRQIDAGPILGKTSLSLEGNMAAIFDALSWTSRDLCVDFFKQWPNVTERPQVLPRHHVVLKRLHPEDGKLHHESIDSMSCEHLYNFIRCRESPYPNAFIQDETGTLYFERVRFEEA